MAVMSLRPGNKPCFTPAEFAALPEAVQVRWPGHQTLARNLGQLQPFVVETLAVRQTPNVGPEVGPASALSSLSHRIAWASTRIVWADLTPFSLKARVK